jgi:carboxyl-terminal processing protease
MITTKLALTCLLTVPALAVPTQDVDYAADVEFALDALEQNCGHFFELKDIDWKKVRKTFSKEAKDVTSHQEHLVLLVRLLARLEDGHAQVRPTEATQGIRWPDDGKGPLNGPGMFWCRVGKKVYVKNAWNAAEEVGIEPGWEVLKVDGEKPDKWLAARVAELSDTISFSTDQQAEFYARHWGLAQPMGTRMKLEFKDERGKKRKKTITYGKCKPVPWGPAFYPEGTVFGKDVHHARFSEDLGAWGYIQVRRCKGNLPEQIDAALEALGDVPGLILDFRGNSGGGFDHDAVLGRFVPKGHQLRFAKRIPSAGPKPYGGPVVVIVDATARSAGETGSGMFKEDGRAYMIGESATAGMSSSKRTLDLPSGLFQLYVSVASNKGRFNQGRGIEGLGVIPHELVQFDPEDLAQGVDTLIRVARERLAKFPQAAVPYDPKDFGWGE